MQLAYIHHHHTQVKSREDGYVSLGSNLNLVSNLANCITSSTTTTLEILPRLKLELWMVNTTYKYLMIRTSRTPEACVAHSVMLSRCRFGAAGFAALKQTQQVDNSSCMLLTAYA